MNKKEAWEKIKKLDIRIPFKERIFDLIEQNFNKIEFVKDHIGLKNFFFMAEYSTAYASEMFITLNVRYEKGSTLEEMEKMMYKKYTDDSIEVLKKLEEYLLEGEDVLAIGIGFEGSEPNETDTISVEYAYKKGKINSKLEGYRRIREKKMPLFFRSVACMPEDINKNELSIQDKEKLLMKKIDDSLDKNDENSFLKWTEKINKIKQL